MFYDVIQNTDEWLEMRAGKVTGSAIAKVMANFGKAFGEPAKRYAVDIAVERMKGSAIIGERYMNAHMEAGHVEEPIARMLYENEFFTTVDNGGFFDNGKTGCSPDGLVGLNGAIEIKSVVPASHYKVIKTGKVDPAYKWQNNFNLMETGREWIDYISFCEQFVPEARLADARLYAEDAQEEFGMIRTRLGEFEQMVDKITADIKAYKK